MANIESTPRKLVLKEGSTTLTLHRRSPARRRCSTRSCSGTRSRSSSHYPKSSDVAVKSDKDGLSGATIYHSVLHRRGGQTTVLTTEEAKGAEATVKSLRDFVGL